jgi:hypothetical protein
MEPFPMSPFLGPYLRCARLQGTHADATWSFVFLEDFGVVEECRGSVFGPLSTV